MDIGIADALVLVGKLGHDLPMVTRWKKDGDKAIDGDGFCRIPITEGSRYDGASVLDTDVGLDDTGVVKISSTTAGLSLTGQGDFSVFIRCGVSNGPWEDVTAFEATMLA